ncbi:MAG: SDR family NAD(P)-dependent oxidoreductase [Desulfobacterales bacterium]|nr:SDR family NAD(P)-dependent oxidoreductase [Desulfobacterales bacterium]
MLRFLGLAALQIVCRERGAMKDFNGKTVLLTGASGGIGRHIARLFAERGVNLALAATARSEEKLTALAKEVASAGAQSMVVTADITDAAQRSEMIRQAEDRFGPVDILINNAGIEEVMAFHLLTEENLARIIEINLNSPLALAREVLSGMLERRRGSIVNVSSLSGKVPVAYSAVYSATKAGLIAWNKAMGDELAGTGVRMSVVCPTYVAGEGMHAAYGVAAPKLAGEVTPEAVAKAVLRALEKNVSEILVTAGPMRPLLAIRELFPGFENFLMKRIGMGDFLRRRAEGAERSRQSENHGRGA